MSLLVDNASNQVQPYFEIKFDENDVPYYFYKKPIRMHVYSNISLNFDFLMSFLDKYIIWLEYERRLYNSLEEGINDSIINITSSFYLKSLNFINFISHNTRDIYENISIKNVKFICNDEPKSMEEIIRKVIFFQYRILAFSLRENNQENYIVAIIFDNYVDIATLCDNIMSNSEIQNYLNNN